MSVAGIGVDVVSLERMQRVITRSPAFVRRVFSEQERHYCEHSRNKVAHYAARWAAKEAVVKALGCGFLRGVKYSDVEIARDKHEKPMVILHGRLKEHADKNGVLKVYISLSHTHELALANALAVSEEALPKKEEKVRPKEQLQASFRELRSILDDPQLL